MSNRKSTAASFIDKVCCKNKGRKTREAQEEEKL